MARHNGGQLGLAEALIHPSIGKNAQLERIGELVDWAAIEQTLEVPPEFRLPRVDEYH